MENKKRTGIRLTKKTKRVLYAFLVAIVILLIAITAAQKLGNVTVSTMFADVKAYFMSMGSGDGFPYIVDEKSIIDVNSNNSNLILLTDEKTEILTSTAKEISPQPHKYSSPVMKTNGSLAIVYDLDSGKFRLQNSSGVTYEKEMKTHIMAAAIGKKGNYAVGTYGTDVQSVLTVYNSANKEIYIWNFKSERISDISLSDSGKTAAVSTIYSNNGKISSKLYILEFKSDKAKACFDYPSTVIVKTDYVSDNDISVIGDNMRSYIRNEKAKIDESYNSDNIKSYSLSDDGKFAVVFSKYGSTSLSSLKVYNSNNKEKFSVDFEQEVKWVSYDGKYTAVLFENEIKTFDNRGKEIGSISFSGEPEKVVIDGADTYLLTASNIQCFKTRGNHTEENTKKAEK